ncbi:PREDICTED: ubiquitin-like-specific protease 1D isoform X2 [Nicotiana attenuata]|uniref:ubiquitin-like-specific protease 1D isoform X2 n=1 Tax=Nicotiana attenuata TaxID=49451 RepID=UPI0009056DC9|nr:PREDICTED: ubiquitin-like-specific protease 1D isoform X2 [Nicotiana attenuata]
MKKGLLIDWNKLINDADDEPPAEIVVTTKAPPAAAAEIHQPTIAVDGEEQSDELSVLTNAELTDKIARRKKLLGSRGAMLPDGGEKLKANIKKHEDELERRKFLRSDKENGCASLGRHRSGSIGALDGLGQRSTQSTSPSQSAFAACFSNKLEEKADTKSENAFQNELHALNPCGRKRTLNKQFPTRKRHKIALSSREEPFKFRVNIDEQDFYADRKRRDISTRYSEESFSSCFPEKWKASQAQSSCTLRHVNDEAVVLVDEEEPDVVEIRQQVHVVESTMAAKIYYPSRDDPESVEICYSDMESLAPAAYLSSTIMNFYIRYLQQTKSLADGERCAYHFFNTYFYNKLKEAVFSKNDKEASFVKLRRWWKGVNIFEKAYIFLPIHEKLHWSLVIICIPDKEDQLGPILLHLDSLGLHCSRSLFDTMKKFLVEEWKFLRQGEVADLPIADEIWDNLPRRIDDIIIQVPQQRNEYDCGLFVLFFIERFIVKVHERLKEKDLAMFGRKLFEPEEASSMRRKIRNILKEKFKKSSDK